MISLLKTLATTQNVPQKNLTDDIKLEGVVDIARGRVAIQRDSDKMKEWFNRDLMKINAKTGT